MDDRLAEIAGLGRGTMEAKKTVRGSWSKGHRVRAVNRERYNNFTFYIFNFTLVQLRA